MQQLKRTEMNALKSTWVEQEKWRTISPSIVYSLFCVCVPVVEVLAAVGRRIFYVDFPVKT